MARQKARVEKEIDIEKIDEQISKEESIDKVKEEVVDDRPLEEKIETKRQEFLNSYQKTRRISNIVLVIVMVVVIGAFVLFIQNNMALKITGGVLAGLAIVGLITFHFVSKKHQPDVEGYKDYIVRTFNTYCYRESEYSNVKYEESERLESSDLMSDKVYSEISKIASRNIIHGEFKGVNFTVGDAAAYNSNPKDKMPVFVGKYISIKNDLHFEGRYILVNKMKTLAPEDPDSANPNLKPCDLPTDTSDLTLLVDEETFQIYGPEGGNATKELGKDFVERIKKMPADGNLLNLNVVVWAGHSAAYMSYGDPVIALPFEHPYKAEPMEKFDQDQYKLLGILTSLCGKAK